MTTRSQKVMDNLDQSINPLTRRKFQDGPVGKALTAMRKHVTTAPGPLGNAVWSNPQCKGAFINGKCFSSKKQTDTLIGVSRLMKNAETIDKSKQLKAIKDIQQEKPQKDARVQRNELGKRYKKLQAEKGQINSDKSRMEVNQYLQKKEMNRLIADKKKLEEAYARLLSEYKLVKEQLNSLTGGY